MYLPLVKIKMLRDCAILLRSFQLTASMPFLSQAAVINLDDPVAPQLLEQVRGFPVVTYGIDNADADVVAESARFTIWESEVIVKTPLGKLQVQNEGAYLSWTL